jgi:4-hydroxy-tetrahydrodipicolinate synthase
MLLVTPYYNKATQRGLVESFRAIADASTKPCILYNVPSRTGSNIMPATVAELVKNVDNIIGIKDATGNISQTMQTMYLCQGDIDLYSGNDDQIVPVMAAGGKGVISVLSNVAPRQTHEMCAKYLAGDVAGAAQMQLDAIDLIEALFCEVNPIPVKKAVNLMGMNAGTLRLPLTEMEEATTARLKASMEAYGIL